MGTRTGKSQSPRAGEVERDGVPAAYAERGVLGCREHSSDRGLGSVAGVDVGRSWMSRWCWRSSRVVVGRMGRGGVVGDAQCADDREASGVSVVACAGVVPAAAPESDGDHREGDQGSQSEADERAGRQCDTGSGLCLGHVRLFSSRCVRRGGLLGGGSRGFWG
ncbi:hypothetical protein, partial [Amycolatopsis acididurans]|uniref:hypothetical protein n=1 Tax=Amycolatopsis acididurans TaxID=2724524 RepID=UPI001FECFC70